MDAPQTPTERTLARLREVERKVAPLIETYHPKLPKGKPFTISVDKPSTITVELKPRGGREAVLVTIESLDKCGTKVLD